MTIAQEMAHFTVNACYEQLPEAVLHVLKIHLLDSVGCAIGALDAEPILMLRAHLNDFADARHCTLIGGGYAAPDRAALFNGALVRYLDFNDSYLAPGETCHPSDNLSAVMAACEYARESGKTLLTALAVAYQVQCRLSDEAPVRSKGFDHTTQGAYAIAAGVARALGLNETQTAHAIAISGTAFNSLRVTRTGALSHWKGLAYPNTAGGATQAVFLARRGITGPLEVFEGNKGFMDTIAGQFTIDWYKESLTRVTQTILKKYNAEIHSQSAIEGLLELRNKHNFTADDIETIEAEIFSVAFHIIGGGEEGEKVFIRTKEEADHSLPYILAVALLDGTVMPEQYKIDRIMRDDVQALLHRIHIRPREDFNHRFPNEMPCRLVVRLKNGSIFEIEKQDYAGFITRPMSWEQALEKFNRLTQPHLQLSQLNDIIQAISQIENLKVNDLTRTLVRITHQAA